MFKWWRKKPVQDNLLHCPHCNAVDWIVGPSGGMSEDILCVKCHYEYQTGFGAPDAIYEPCPDDRLISVYGVQPFNPLLEELKGLTNAS